MDENSLFLKLKDKYNSIDSKSVFELIRSAMELVEHYNGVSGIEKKEMVITVVDRIVYELGVGDDFFVKVFVENFLDDLIDNICDIAKGNLDINSKLSFMKKLKCCH